MTSTPHPPLRTGKHPRAHWVIVLLVLGAVFKVTTCVNNFHYFTVPGPSVYLMNWWGSSSIRLKPVTRTAEMALAGVAAKAQLVAINGQSLARLDHARLAFGDRQPLKLKIGEQNTFVFKLLSGRMRKVSLPVSLPQAPVVARHLGLILGFHFVGLLYLAIGLLVWWRRPNDRAAGPLLFTGVVAVLNLSVALSHTMFDIVFATVGLAAVPLWGLSGLLLTAQFTGSLVRRRVHLFYRAVRAVTLTTSVMALVLCPLSLFMPDKFVALIGGLLLVASLEVVICVVMIVPIAWRAGHGPHPRAIQLRARLFAKAAIIAFAFPSASLVLQGVGVWYDVFSLITMVSLAVFPVIIGYAIARHQMFDLRIVLRRGVVAAALTTVISLVYVALVLGAVKIAAAKAPSPLLIGLSVPLVVVLFAILHTRAQRMVARFASRDHKLHVAALTEASEALSHHRDMDSITRTVRDVLVNTMELRRVHFAVRDPENKSVFRCLRLDGSVDDQPCKRRRLHRWLDPQALPDQLDPARFGPVARALRTGSLVSAHDALAVSAQSMILHAGSGQEQRFVDESVFWSCYGVEALVPLSLGDGESAGPETPPRLSLADDTLGGGNTTEVVGLLILGPKKDDRPLDPDDHATLHSLSNQLAVAVENCYAFEEIQRLNDGLEQQVQERTHELTEALAELQDAQAQLIESEMQTMLTRLVAGILHEVNSPLGTLRSSVDTMERALDKGRRLLEDGPVAADDEVRSRRVLRALRSGGQLAQVASQSSDRITAVLDSLRRFVSLDEAAIKPLELRRSIEDALTILAPSTGRGVEVITDFPDEPVEVRCYPARLNKVFLNLLQNALTALEGSGQLKVVVQVTERKVMVLVGDNGRGIPESMQKTLFDFGFTTKHSGRVGMRLGLPSAKRWVEEIGGRLTLTSEQGRGTRVEVTLPRGKHSPLARGCAA